MLCVLGPSAGPHGFQHVCIHRPPTVIDTACFVVWVLMQINKADRTRRYIEHMGPMGLIHGTCNVDL